MNSIIKKKEKGEVIKFMEDIKTESETMMRNLMEVDDKLLSLEDRLELGEVDKKEILKIIESVRLRIGVLEKEDRRELGEEEIAESLLGTLKKWVDQVV